MARRSRRAATFGAPRATPKPTRWRLQARPLALVGGLVGGIGAAVLVQQYAVAPLTYTTLGIAVGAGLGIAVVVPSAVFGMAVALHNLRAKRRRAAAAVPAAVVSIVVLATVLGAGARAAGASITGPCLGAVNGVDIGARSPTKSDAIEVADPGRVHVVLRSFGTIERGRLVARLPARDVTMRDVGAVADLAADPHVFEYEVRLTESAWVGGGLQRLRAEATVASEGVTPEATCHADFMVSVAIDPLATMPGRAGAIAVLSGALLVLGSAAGGARSVRIRSLNELRRSFADLEAARSQTARVGLPAGPSWARAGRAAGGAPLPAQKAHWWHDTDAAPALAAVPEPERAIGREIVTPVRDGPGEGADPTGPRRDDEPREAVLAPVIAFEPRALEAPDGAPDSSTGAEPNESAAGLAPVLSFEPRGSGTGAPALGVDDARAGAPQTGAFPGYAYQHVEDPEPDVVAGMEVPIRDTESGYAFQVHEPAEGEARAATPPAVDPEVDPDVDPEVDDLDATITALEVAAKAMVANGGNGAATDGDAEHPEPESTRRWFPWGKRECESDESDESEPEPATDFALPVEPGPEPEITRTGVRATARSLASDAAGAGVLGPPTLEAKPVLGDASAAALHRWTHADDDVAMVPDLERTLQDVLNDLPVGLVTRGRLSAAIDRTLMRAEVEEWVERVGRPSPVLAEADAWRGPSSDEILRALLTPSPYIAGLADRMAVRAGDEHDWDLCVQEVAWPWA